MISEIIQNNKDKYLMLSGEQMLCPHHMVMMLQKCNIDCFMPLKYTNNDEFIYDTLGGSCLSCYMQKKGYAPELLKKLLYSIKDMQKIAVSYLIDQEYIVFDVKYIYIYENETFKYILDPFCKNDANIKIKELIADLTENSFINKSLTEALSKEDFNINIAVNAFNATETSSSEIGDKEVKKAVLKNIIDTDDCIIVREKDVTVGRIKLFCDYRLPGKLASAKHASLRYSHNTVYIRDLSSKNGTYINGERIKPNSYCKAKRGDIVSFGDDEYILM